MALVAKSNRKVAPMNSERGQISIFFSASLVVFISIIAFVINVGLFVKAKINLQNATDASAFAGAAVQSRQLTKIAYLNWEMRNIFKEWMYKYYVVGSLNTPMVEKTDTLPPINCAGKKCMDFRLEADNDVLSGRVNFDPYNFPAVCIHIAGGSSKTNICKRYAVPGLPEFGGYNIPGTEEASRSFIDVLIGEKVNDCVERSKINMLVATTWAFNVLANESGDTLTGRGPAILTDRQGAWPQAIELAMRIRNLEKVMNREARTTPVKRSDIEQIPNQNFLGDERIVKAFFSGYRNLGSQGDREMKDSFSLQELPPIKPPIPQETSSSSLLIPTSELYSKQFVDLKLMMVNYATFYAALIARSEKDKSGACDISKVALPVPGYPLGFYKNPDVVTYYAVKGEAEFQGMFNPFSQETIKLTAYAAAKPMGGRIGPMLFKQTGSETSIRTRTEPGKYRSVPYISSLKVDRVANPFMNDGYVDEGEYGPGAPLPINTPASPFWIDNADSPVGGAPQGEKVKFGVPNLVYDFLNGDDLSATSYTDGGSNLFIIQPGASTPPSDFSGDRAVGLFNYDQFKAFKGNIGGQVTPAELADQISRVRAATRYEAANYLIPTPFDLNIRLGVDSFGAIGGSPTTTNGGVERYRAEIYAPLYKGVNGQLDLLYNDSNAVFKTIVDFMRQQEPGMINYMQSLNRAAIQVYQTALTASVAAVGAVPNYEKAAKGISDIDVTGTDITAFPKSCDSLAGQFWFFYYGFQDLFPARIQDQSSCPITLGEQLQEYFAKSAADPNYSPLHYRMEYNYNKDYWGNSEESQLKIFSGYMPGPYNGISTSGLLIAPSGFPQQKEVMRRNFYSTKLVTLDSLRQSDSYNQNTSNFNIYSEGDLTGGNATPDRKQGSFSNPIDAQSVGADISSIRY